MKHVKWPSYRALIWLLLLTKESVFLITTDTCFGYFVIFKFNVYQKLGHSKEDRSASYGF